MYFFSMSGSMVIVVLGFWWQWPLGACFLHQSSLGVMIESFKLSVCVCHIIRSVFALGEAQDLKELSYLQTGQQLVLHLPSPHFPVPWRYDQPLLWWVDAQKLRWMTKQKDVDLKTNKKETNITACRAKHNHTNMHMQSHVFKHWK